MTKQRFTESDVEEAALAWLDALDFAVLYSLDITAVLYGEERNEPNLRDVVLEGRLCQALVRLNPGLLPAPCATRRCPSSSPVICD